jgi:hypothetical protein
MASLAWPAAQLHPAAEQPVTQAAHQLLLQIRQHRAQLHCQAVNCWQQLHLRLQTLVHLWLCLRLLR